MTLRSDGRVRCVPGPNSARSIWLRHACMCLALLALVAACRDLTWPSRCANVPAVQDWTNLGPAGELIRSIAVTPAGLLVGTKADGVLRYNSCNGHWDALGLADRLITSIAPAPAPSHRLLITLASGVDAVLYASDDYGRTWHPHDGGLSAQTGYRQLAFSVAVDSSDASRLFLGLPAAVMRSLDGGATWTTVHGDSLAAGLAVWCLAVVPPGSSRVWAGGASVGETPLLLRSDDRGSTWVQLAPTSYWGDMVFALAPDPQAPDRLFVGMASGLRETEDAGATWRLILPQRYPGNVTGVAVAGGSLVAASDELIVTTDSITNVLGLYLSRDRGATWDTLVAPRGVTGGVSLAIGSDGTAFVGTKSGVWAVPLP